MASSSVEQQQQSRTIRPISSGNIVENGALIVVTGKPNSGKTCVVENLLLYSMESFSAQRFPPLYIAEDAEYGQKYFGQLFAQYLPMSVETKNQVEIWQFGYEDELEKAKFKAQGVLFQESQLQCAAVKRSKPRILFYFDRCDSNEEIQFVEQCLANIKDHRRKHFISIVETSNTSNYLPFDGADLLVFTSRIDWAGATQYFTNALDCNKSIAEDLIKTANTFIDATRVALVVNLHQWFETEKKRGLYIYAYDLVPRLDERIKKHDANNHEQSATIVEKTVENLQNSVSVESHKKRHRHRRRHARK